MPAGKLRIGYLWQYEAAGLSPVSATALHVRSVIRALERRGHQVRMVTVRNGQVQWSDDLETWRPVQPKGSRSPGRPPASPFERGVRGLQKRLHLPFIRWFDSQRFSRPAAAALEGCDVLYERFWLLAYGGLLAARRLGIPLVYEVNGDLVEEYDLLGIRLSGSQWAANHWVTRQMFQRAARVVTVSPTLRQQTIARWKLDPEQVTTVSNGADLALFAPQGEAALQQASAAAQARTRYDLDGQPLVIFVGSFKPWHGLDLLLKAFEQLAPAQPDARLLFVGDGPARPALEEEARQAGLENRVVFTGAVPHQEVSALLGAAQVAVVNPRFSPASLSQSPLKLFEYMAAGKAIVAPALPNLQSVLTDRQNALLVPPDQPEALAHALGELLSDETLRTSLGQAARQQAIQQHSWDQTAAELEAIFYQELKGAQRHA